MLIHFDFTIAHTIQSFYNVKPVCHLFTQTECFTGPVVSLYHKHGTECRIALTLKSTLVSKNKTTTTKQRANGLKGLALLGPGFFLTREMHCPIAVTLEFRTTTMPSLTDTPWSSLPAPTMPSVTTPFFFQPCPRI